MRALLLLAPLLLAFQPPAPQPPAPQPPAPQPLHGDDDPFEDIGIVSADAMNTHCLACHSAAMVTSQPPLTRAQWQAVLDKMRTLYKAPIDASEDAALLAWLEAREARPAPSAPQGG
jgi:hypothetical protein